VDGEEAMKRYIVKRLLLMIPTFIGITIITYTMVRLAPGDYTTLKAGAHGGLKSGTIGKEYLEAEKKLYGLDKPIYAGYLDWVSKFITLDMGKSRKDGRPVIERIGEALPITLSLNIISIVIIYMVSIPLGIFSSIKKDTTLDRGITLVLFVLYSLPPFWVGLILIMVFSSGEYLDLFPLGGWISDFISHKPWYFKAMNVFWHMVLPVVTMTYGGFAFLSRFTRANMLEVLNQQFVTTARAKGLSQRKVVMVHAFRNSMISLVTLMATLLPGLLGGSVIIEQIFSIPGMGLLAYEALLSRDIPVIMAIAAISALLTLGGILLADLMYAVVDPRIRLEEK
jgi:peptide/nickel transport system permease protein